MDLVVVEVVIGLGLAWLLVQWLLEQMRDVRALYLEQQLYTSPYRAANESAIYRSCKCDDFEHGPRVGLDIRYDHYKLRHGNLCDMWQLALSSGSTISFPGSDQYLVSQINALVTLFSESVLKEKRVEINTSSWLRGPAAFALMITAMINQRPVKLSAETRSELYINDATHIDPNQKPQASDSNFVNEYEPIKDTGVAICLEQHVSAGFSVETSFTQLSLISAIASTLKHLPPQHSFSPRDHLVVMLDGGANDCIGQVIKVMAALISGCNVSIADSSLSRHELHSMSPTILLVLCKSYQKVFQSKPNLWELFKAKQLTRGVFLGANTEGLRLIYLHQSIFEEAAFSTLELNQIRSSSGARLVYERTHYSVAGGVILNDIFDYRVHNVACRASGSICQSLEIKLKNVAGDGTGRVYIRGFSIGKLVPKGSTNEDNESIKEQTIRNRNHSGNEEKGEADARASSALRGLGAGSAAGPQWPEKGKLKFDQSSKAGGDGFMPLDVSGKWGIDGCLYVF